VWFESNLSSSTVLKQIASWEAIIPTHEKAMKVTKPYYKSIISHQIFPHTQNRCTHEMSVAFYELSQGSDYDNLQPPALGVLLTMGLSYQLLKPLPLLPKGHASHGLLGAPS
jgi:hypothetical protein